MYKVTAIIKAVDLLDAWSRLGYLPYSFKPNEIEHVQEGGVVEFSLGNEWEYVAWSSGEVAE